MRSGLPYRFAALALLLIGLATPAAAQEQTYALVLRGVPLDDALDRFVRTTGRAVTYDPQLVQGERAFCAMETGTAEEVLRCLLSASGLDFYRLSSGTYVLTRPAEVAPAYGMVAGVVVDEETGTPLPGAHILLADAGVGTVTNQAGQFVLPPLRPGRYALSITYLGYRDWRDSLRVEPDAQTTTRAALQAEPVLIAPVIVDGLQRRRTSERLRTGTVRTSDPPAGYADGPADALRGLNAVTGVRASDVTADVYVQGGDAGAHEVRLDGAPVYLPLRTLGFIGPFSPFALDRITVHKAGFGVEAGSQVAGVVDARHTLGGDPGLVVQVDPISLNARLQLGAQRSGEPPPTAVMAAARVGLWDLYHPSQLQATLNAWSTPDPFLLRASLEGSGLPAFNEATFQEVGEQAFGGRSPPGVHFSDLHVAARHRLSPLRTLHASAYQGHHRLGGSPFAAFELLRSETDVDVQPPGTAYRTPVTVEDDHAWRTQTGQLRYDAVVGGRSLVSVQARVSTYDLEHRYELLDSLDLLLQPGLLSLNGVSTSSVRDENRMRTYALAGSFDHVQGRHQAQVGADLLLTDSRFGLLAVNLPGLEAEPGEVLTGGEQRSIDAPQRHVLNTTQTWRGALFVRDEVDLSTRTQAEAGVRLTYLPTRQTVYAEPRLALRHDRARWAWRMAAGLYRQFINQYDVSKLNVGALLPSVRIWLPVDGTVRPPQALHLSASTLLRLSPAWSLRGEGYWKIQPYQLTMTYRLPESFGDSTDQEPFRGQGGVLSDQASFLAPAKGRAAGASVEVAWAGERGRASVRYEASWATLRSAARFDGRTVPVPWNEPHRAEVAFDWRPLSPLTLSLRGQGIWGRAWGFRQAYYDYFGQEDAWRQHPPYDLGRPDEHVLPAHYRLDLGLAYTRTLGAIDLQARIDILNVLDRANVLDWRLVYEDDGTLRKEARYAYPRLTTWALKIGW